MLEQDAAAERLFAGGDGLTLGVDGLRATDRVADRALAGAVERALRELGAVPAELLVPRPSGRADHRVTLIPRREAYPWLMLRASSVLVLIEDRDAASRFALGRLAAQFGLTAAEAEVAHAVMQGRSAADMAGETGRSLATVRTHLARVMAKTQDPGGRATWCGRSWWPCRRGRRCRVYETTSYVRMTTRGFGPA